MKIVINTKHGGFGLSDDAVVRYLELQGKEVWIMGDFFKTYSLVPPEERLDVGMETGLGPKNWHSMSMEEKDNWNKTYREQTFSTYDMARNDPALVQVVEELGSAADGSHAELKIVEIPDYVEWQIDEYDGLEWVAEKHRTWS